MQEGPAGGVVGILGETPRPLDRPVRATRYKQLTRLTGDLDGVAAGRCLALHAACHALMNGVSGVVIASVDDVEAPSSWAAAAERLSASGPTSVWVAPGLVDLTCVDALLVAWRALGGNTAIWLDAPPERPVGAIPAWLAERRAGGDNVFAATPSVPSLTPGRTRMEPLAATCIVGPLALRARHELRGVHELQHRYSETDIATLGKAGVAVLVPAGPRRRVRLRAPSGWRPPSPDRGDGQSDSLGAQLATILEEAVADNLRGQAQGPALWRTLARRVRAALQPLERRGEIAGFHVRCDAETNEGSSSPVVEVLLERRAQPVQRFVLRSEPLGAP